MLQHQTTYLRLTPRNRQPPRTKSHIPAKIRNLAAATHTTTEIQRHPKPHFPNTQHPTPDTRQLSRADTKNTPPKHTKKPKTTRQTPFQ
jgi:hypothetical protein